MSNVIPPADRSRKDVSIRRFRGFEALNEMTDTEVRLSLDCTLAQLKELDRYAELLSAWLEADPVRRKRLSSD